MDIVNFPKTPLTSSQLDIFLDQQRAPGSCLYNIGGYFQIIGTLDPTRLISAITAVIRTESAFHLQLDLTGDVPLQYLLQPAYPEIEWLDFYQANHNRQDANEKARQWFDNNFVIPFDLTALLFKLAICKVAPDEHWLYLKTHHLIMDGWSYSLFIKRVVDQYNRAESSEPLALSNHSYWEFIQDKHQRSIDVRTGQTQTINKQKQRDYWRERLANIPGHLLVQRSKNKDRHTGNTTNRHQFVVGKEELAPLLTLASQQNTSAFHALLAVVYCYFMRAAGTKDLVIGTPLHGRTNAHYKQIIGMLAGTFPTRINAPANITYNELLVLIRQSLLRDFRHQDYSLGQIHRDINSLGERRERLYDVFLSYEDFSYNQINGETFQIQPKPLTHRQDQTPFSLFIRQYAITGVFEFDLQLHNDFFSSNDALWIEARFRHLITTLANQPDLGLQQLSWLPEQELCALQTINQYVPDIAKCHHVLDAFASTVQQVPHKTAVIGCDKTLTYLELDQTSDTFAQWLMNQKINRGTCIGVCMDRSSDLLVVLLGIWKAGTAYIPLDPEYPATRLQQVVKHSQLQWVITHATYTALFANMKIHCCTFSNELISAGNINQQMTLPTTKNHSLKDLAYVIYTSGSTGVPKGVAIEQGSMANFLAAMSSTPGITRDTTLLAVTTISFDIHILELFLPLVNGATLLLATSNQSRDAFALRDLMHMRSINMMQATPATWKMLFHADWQPVAHFKALCGGEAMPPALLEKFSQYPEVELWNMYGPTEATVWSSTALMQGIDSSAIHLGHPIANSRYFVLDALGYPAGFNLPGELYIGGYCLARDYIHDPEKTSASFLWRVLPGMDLQRIYKTGDSVELSDHHQLYFRSRNDDQVKVRGYRIELGDVEAALMKHPTIKDAAVKIWRDARDENYLAAYCVTKTVNASDKELASYLKQYLPDYMLPTAYTWLDALPLTNNGKLNRKALAEPRLHHLVDTQELPQSTLEQIIASIWSEILNVKSPGRWDEFFRLGGDSISNIQLVNRLRKCGIAAEASDIFQHSRLGDLARILSERTAETSTEIIPISEPPQTDRQFSQPDEIYTLPFPLSSAQQRLYILQQLESAATAYNMYGAFLIRGPINSKRLTNAFTQLLQRHSQLCCRFYENQGELLQQPLVIDQFALDQHLLPEEFFIEPSNWLTITINQFVKPFDLDNPPLVRAQLWREQDKTPGKPHEKQQHVLLIDMHHLVADGISINIFLRDLFALYEQQVLEPLPVPYRDFIQQQTQWLHSAALQPAAHYWLQQFSGELPSLDFPIDYTRPAQQQFSGKRLRFLLDEPLSAAVKQLARQHNISLFMLLLAAYNLLLAKYTGQEDIIVGTPVSNRPDENFGDLVGLFVNTLPLRHYPSPEKKFADFLQEIKTNCSQALRYKNYPFERLIGDLSLARDLSRNPLFDFALVLQAEVLPDFNTQGLAINPLPIDYRQAKFDLTLDAVDTGINLQFELEYASHLFTAQRIQKMGHHFINLLQQMVEQPEAQIGKLSLLDNRERHQLLHEFNNTGKHYPQQQTLTSIFEQQANKTPHQTAVAFAGQQLSYSKLNAKANQLAHQLLSYGVSKNQIVAVMLERSLEMPIAILAIIKAGAAYLPIAPNLPHERIEYMLADSQAPVLISDSSYIAQLTQFAGKIFTLDQTTLFNGPETNPAPQSGADDLAYVIYTSGSTGQPKGAMVEHRAVVNRIYWMQDKYPLSAADIILQKTPYTFDVSVWELFWWSFAGASVYFLAPDAEKDPQQIFSCIDEQRISTLHFVPSMLTASLEFLAAYKNIHWNLASLRYVFASGEALNPHQVEEFNQLIYPYSGAQLINLYGPTEAAIDVTYFDCPVTGILKRVPIGKPINNIRLHILDNQQQLVAQGIAGELYISGSGVGRGYVNKPELTAEKFLVDPFFPDQRMYRTGDLCRWLEDGNIEYLGRLDHQVKIRGYRIELGEIETCLLSHPAIREATVIALKNTSGQDYLCAYLVARTAIVIDQLRAHLNETLPDYMVPAEFVLLTEMPLNQSGKVDRKQLPAPQINEGSDTRIIDDSLLNESQRSLLRIARELLNNPQLGLDDNFFHNGGDSIRAIQFSARAAQAGFAFGIRDIFKYPCLRQLANNITQQPSVQIQTTIDGNINLTAIQLAFFEQKLTQPDSYCQYVVVKADRFSPARLQRALNLLIQQHPLLTARVIPVRQEATADNENVWQHQLYIAPINNNHWLATQFTQQQTVPETSEIEHQLNQLLYKLQSGICLDGPLYAASILSSRTQDYLLIVIHHLIIDGVSWRILLDDLNRFYQEQEEKNPPAILPLGMSSREWITASNTCTYTTHIQKQFNYWSNVQKSIAPALLDPSSGIAGTVARAGCIKETFTYDETLPLLNKANKAYGTDVQDLLIAAVALAWQQWTGKIRIALDLEAHGRNLPFNDLDNSRSLGWFTAIYPWTVDIDATASLQHTIPFIKESLRRIPDRGIGYGLLKHFGSGLQQKQLRTSRPDILFNFLGHLDTGNPDWQLHTSGLYSGAQNSRSHVFEIIMSIKEGQLHWDIHYPGDNFPAFHIKKFNQLVRTQLLNICAHCSQQTKPTITPSDLGDANIALDTYRQLRQQFARQGPITAIHKLTPTQAGIFFHAQNSPHHIHKQAALYYGELGFYLNQGLDASLLQTALDHLTRTHSILRSFFIAIDADEPRQIVCENASISLVSADISSLEAQARESWITGKKIQLRQAGFDWQQPLVGLHLFKTGTNESMLLFCYHHLVLDGWSCAALLEELLTTYFQLHKQLPLQLHGHKNPLPTAEKRTDFGDYLQWLAEQNPEPARAYWRIQLADITDKIRLPGEITPYETGYHLQEMVYQLPGSYLQGLQQLAAQYDVTLNTLIQAAWGLLLQRYNNTGDALFMSVVSGRSAAVNGIEKMIGLFINTIPVRIVAPTSTDQTIANKTSIEKTIPETVTNKKIANKEEWTQWLRTLQNNQLQAENFSFIGLADIASSAAISTDLFRNLLVFENYPINNQALGNNVFIDQISLFEQTHYDFNLLVQPSDTLDFRFIVNTLVHPAASVARIAGHLLELLRNWADHNTVAFPDNIPAAAETIELIHVGLARSTLLLNKELLNKEFLDNGLLDKKLPNSTSPNDNLVSRFLQQQQLTPQALAVRDGTSQLNYTQLAQQAQQIARHLLAQGITTEQPVVLLANRSCQMIAAMLGILQSGAVVVPVDPHLPDERIHYLLTDSTASCVLVDDFNEAIAQNLPALNQRVISHLLATDAMGQDDKSVQLPLLTGAQLLYLIYTSGTTGIPKGVMLEHRNLLALIDGQKQQGLIQCNKQVLQFATHSFDVCYQEIFSTLLAGGCLHIIDEQQKKDTDYLLDFIRGRNIDTLFLPTAYLKFLFSVPERIAQVPACIKHIITAGEQLLVSPTLRQYLLDRNVLLHNHYGPSETHVVTTQVLGNTLNHPAIIADIPPIGRPVDGTGIYLLDQEGRLQPRGATGEIFIGGAGVGRGYWNQPSLTRERFLTARDFYTLTANPYFASTEFLTTNGDRIYRTGDLGYWNESGELIYLGRADQQVKVRGYRIEPGEIEACLRKLPAVNEAAVLAHRAPQGDNYLVAYLVLEQPSLADFTLGNIKKVLAAQLPVYMQPAFFIPLAHLPMTANGKLDKRALPEINNPINNSPATINQTLFKQARRPANAIQIRLANFWQELLALHDPDLDTDFFAVGGHSLNATSLTAFIQREWAIKISIKELFALRTLEQQADAIADKIAQENIHAKAKKNRLINNEQTANTLNVNLLSSSLTDLPAEAGFIPGSWIPLSSAQQRLYVLDQIAGPGTSYNIPFAAQIQPDINLSQLENSLQQLLERHTILRARIGIYQGQPMQTLMQDAINIQRNIIAAEQLDNYLASWIKPFNLLSDALIRIELMRIKETGLQWLLFDIHHIIADGVSIEILLRELLALYRGEKLPAPEFDYAAVVHWQNAWQHSTDFQIQKHYWLSRYHQLPPVLELPLDFARPPERNTAGAEFSLPMDADLAQALEQFAQLQGTSVFAVALTAYALWLWRYSGETDMAIGIPVSGRSQPAFAQVPGLMVNSLAMRVQLDSEQSAATCLHNIAIQLLEDLQHQDFPFDALIDALHNTLALPRDPGRNALFDTMFSFGDDWVDNAGTNDFFSPYGLPVTEAKFDLAMSLDRHQGQYSLAVNYATRLFTPASAHQMGQHYLIMLRQLIEHAQQPIRKLNCLSPIEYRQLTLDFNNTEMRYPRDSSIAVEFEKIAARYSERLAIHDDGGTLTYRELNGLANRIAACLIQQGLTPQTFVGVMLERSRYWIASMLALLKAGAVYMPIAPDWPKERIRSILQDATAPLLICTPDTANGLVANNCRQIYLDDLIADAQHYSAENISPSRSPTDLAYVIYTSGSTGIPKGVLIEQRGVLNLTQWAGHEYDLEHNPRMLQMTSPGFDVSIEETLVPLLNGAAVFILNDEYKMDKKKFTAFIQQHRIQVAELVPSLLGDYLLDNITLESLVLVITGAERLEPMLKDQILARGYRLHNVYGPTETTVNATSKPCVRGDDTIGKPMANSSAFILDTYGRIQPIGVPGELCISGDNLARGYHQRETLTAEKFVANPFAAGARLYRTGDLAKWTSDGEIRFIGRIDQQVKIRGYRIETGDVENRLAAIAGIHQAIVTVRQQETANASLCAYYTGTIALDETWLRQQLAQWLPDYMLPTHFIYLASIPLTPNGKVDKKALPQPELAIRTNYQAPRTPVELQLEYIWCHLLGGDNYSVTEDFFRAGGHSLLAIKLLAAINQQWSLSLTLTEIFTHSMLENLARLIAQRHEGAEIASSNGHYNLFNPAALNALFLFPPALGESMVYGRLSQQLPDYRCYCFNYLDDPERLEIYADTIVAAQTTGKIYLLGYSAGGNLAFEVAQILEARGHQLGGLILLDSVRREQPGQAPERAQIALDLQTAFARNQLALDVATLTPLIEQAYSYAHYTEQLINQGTLNVPVHLIKAPIPIDVAEDYGWAELAPDLCIHAGVGEHLDLLAEPNLGYNARVIAGCLHGVMTPFAGVLESTLS